MKTHTITINQDMICEDESTEFFYSSLSLDTSVYHQISLSQPQVRVNINDSEEAECSKSMFIVLPFILPKITHSLSMQQHFQVQVWRLKMKQHQLHVEIILLS